MATFKMILILVQLFSFTFDVSNTIKWYVYDSTTAHPIQKRYEDLWKYGCCQDTIECQADGPKYLGMDVFMRALNRTEYLLLIHQVNYMVSSVFGLDYLPSEITIGRIGKDIDIDFTNHSWARKLQEFCPHGESKESRFITGFSVVPLKASYLVCGDNVLSISFDYAKHETNIKNTVNRNGHCICQKNETPGCENLHPVFCDNDSGRLMSIAAVPTRVNDPNPYLYGFYSTHSKHETATAPRKYTVKVWRYQSLKKDPIHVTSSTGYLTEVDTFKEDVTGYYGMYFTNDGNACPFHGTYADDAKIKDQSDLTFEYLKTPRKPCLSFQLFIGCPQPWCFSNRFDSSFTMTDKYGKNTYITFAVGNFAWQVKDTGLPLKPPTIKEANKPIFKKGKDLDLLHIQFLPCDEFLTDPEMVSCAIPNIGAAFAYKMGSWVIVYYSTSLKYMFVTMAWWYVGTLSKKNLLKGNSNETNFTYDAFWPNFKEKIVYGFIGQKYEKFTMADFPPKFINVAGQLNEFHIEAPLLDAVVNRENKGYFFYNNFFYEVPEDNWRNKASQSKIFAMENFFDVRKECYANDNEAYEKLVSRFVQRKYTVNKTVIGDVILITRNTQKPSTKAPRSRMYILYIAVFGILIVVGVLVGFFTFGTMAGRKGRTKSISKVKKSKTLPTGSPSLKSSPKTPKGGGKKTI